MQNKELVGKKIKIRYMKGSWDYKGREGIVSFVDDIGQLHGTWGGLAVMPGEDKFDVIEE